MILDLFEIKIVRTDGADGDISCMYKVEKVASSSHPAREYDDFVPDYKTIKFPHSSCEQVIQVSLVPKAIDDIASKTEEKLDKINNSN